MASTNSLKGVPSRSEVCSEVCSDEITLGYDSRPTFAVAGGGAPGGHQGGRPEGSNAPNDHIQSGDTTERTATPTLNSHPGGLAPLAEAVENDQQEGDVSGVEAEEDNGDGTVDNIDAEVPVESEVESEVFEPDVSDPDVGVMMREVVREERETRGKRTAEESPQGKPATKRSNAPPPVPQIILKTGDLIVHDGQVSSVTGRGGKRRGTKKNWYNLKPVDPNIPEYSADFSRIQYHKLDQDGGERHHTMITVHNQQEEVHMAIIPYNQHGNLECREAKKVEIDKILQFDAVEVVPDVGQARISSRFVLWYKKHSDGTVVTRARLVARGYEEEDAPPSDSPTLDQINLKVILMLAQAFNMDVISLDIKSAFLQGLPLTERTVHLIPPPEAGVPKGHIWKLKVALYGLDDASLRFHWKVRQVFKTLGMKQSRYDPAMFYQTDTATGKVVGLIGTHVDDFLMAGSKPWLNAMKKKVAENFTVGSEESQDYLYCGHRIKQDGKQLTLDQEEFAAEIKPLLIEPGRKKNNQAPVTDKERAQIRSYAGKLGWLGRTTRPDLLQAQIEASSMVTKATVGDLKNLAKAVARVGQERSIQVVPRLPDNVNQWELELYTDASWQNIDDIGSTGGKVIIVRAGAKSFPVTWSSNRLRRTCHSSQQAEIMALNEGLKDLGYVREMINEITGVTLNTTLLTDNKNVYSSVIATTAPQDKKVKVELASVREALRNEELGGIKHIPGNAGMLADPLTKRRASAADLLSVIQTGRSLGEERDQE